MRYEPLISVIMSTYNEKIEWLDKAINSILNQSYKKIEFIILLDNPKNEEIKRFLLNIRDDRIKIIINEKNLGLVKSLNKGLDEAKGEFIARMDADDISEIDRLEKQVNFLLKNEDIVLVGTNMNYINGYGKELKVTKNFVIGVDRIIKRLKYDNIMNHPTFMFRKDIICNKTIQKYREIYSAEDYDLVCRLINNGYKIDNLDEKLLRYRIRDNSITRSNELGQVKVSLYISRLYKNNQLNDIDFNYLEKLKKDKAGEKRFLLSNRIKNKYNEKNKLIRMIAYLIANSISYYSFIRMYKKICWKIGL